MVKVAARGEKGSQDESSQPVRPSILYWFALLVIILTWGFIFSIIQPPGGPADEDAHMTYVRFLADNQRLPRWQANGGGEAGYESQHPPLYYGAAAVVYELTSPLADNWRYYVTRWFSLLIGLALFWVVRGFSLDYFKGKFAPAFATTAAFSLTPLLLMHISYINVDILSVLMCSIVLWMSLRVARGSASNRDRVVLSVALGLGLLTKLTILGMVPVVVVAHALDPMVKPGLERQDRLVRFFFTFIGAVAISGWWYIRCRMLYGTPFTHTIGRFGSGTDLAASTGDTAHLMWFSIRETYLSTWAQRGWMHPGVIEVSLYVILSAFVLLAGFQGLKASLADRDKSRTSLDPAPWLLGICLICLIIGHQVQVWFVDYEFNAGGRYLLNGLIAIQALIISGLCRLKRQNVWLIAWVALFFVMDLVSAHRILAVLNPMYAPGWQMFRLR